jgi:hypothetical protein
MSSPIIKSPSAKAGASALSAEMNGLLEHKKQIRQWLTSVEQRIWELEETYLDETPMGNIIRGWEMDGKPPSFRRGNEDKDQLRLFSYSSYDSFMERNSDRHKIHGTYGDVGSVSAGGPGNLFGRDKIRKRKNQYDEFDEGEGDGFY